MSKLLEMFLLSRQSVIVSTGAPIAEQTITKKNYPSTVRRNILCRSVLSITGEQGKCLGGCVVRRMPEECSCKVVEAVAMVSFPLLDASFSCVKANEWRAISQGRRLLSQLAARCLPPLHMREFDRNTGATLTPIHHRPVRGKQLLMSAANRATCKSEPLHV